MSDELRKELEEDVLKTILAEEKDDDNKDHDDDEKDVDEVDDENDDGDVDVKDKDEKVKESSDDEDEDDDAEEVEEMLLQKFQQVNLLKKRLKKCLKVKHHYQKTFVRRSC